MGTISNHDFLELIGRRGRRLFSLGRYVVQGQPAEGLLTRPLLGDLLSEATQFEELLDAYGARKNRRWRLFRLIVATIKRFSDAGYELLHIRHSARSYQLLPIERDFAGDTERALAFSGKVLAESSSRLLARAESLGVALPAEAFAEASFSEELPPGQLAHDCVTRKVKSVGEIVTHLATAFLNLAAESEVVHVARRAKPDAYAACVPDPVSEERLRYLQQRFHNLQSLYDTYVLETEVESVDADLPVLRGHISVVFHLLQTGTHFAHYYERHVTGTRRPLADGTELLNVLMDYSISYASQYISCAQQLCHEMLQRYAEVTEMAVPVPRYRGFHVRPSTLVAKIVRHYGSEVRMELDGEVYDAGTPLEIFRANEKINARKRQSLAAEIAGLPMVQNHVGEDVQSVARQVVRALAEEGKLTIYEQPLRLPEEPVARRGTVLQWVIDEIARLQALGKIDINADLSICFRGDKRVLADIKLLAESGYGEDNFGNNIPLPKGLSYLRR